MAQILKRSYAQLFIGITTVILATSFAFMPKTSAAEPYLYGELGPSGTSVDKVTAYIKASEATELKYLTGSFGSQTSYISLSSLEANPNMDTESVTENLDSGRFSFNSPESPLSLNADDVVWTAVFGISNDAEIGSYGIEICPEMARFSPDETQYYNCTTVQVPVEAAYQSMYYSESEVEKTIEDNNFTNPLTQILVPGDITYSSTNEDVATVDPDTGEVTILDIGDTEIIATASAYGRFYETDASYVLTVSEVSPTPTPTPTPEPTPEPSDEGGSVIVPDTGYFTGSSNAINVASIMGIAAIITTTVAILSKRATKKKVNFDKK